jgi:hypothetical protein
MGLRGEVQFYGRAEPAGKMDDAGVGRDEPVHSKFGQGFQLLFHRREMLVAGHGVQAVIDALPGLVDKLDGVFQCGIIEAAAFGAERKRTAAKIDCVGSVEQGGFQLFASAGRGKEFWFAHGEHHSSIIGWNMRNTYTPFARMTSGAGQILF